MSKRLFLARTLQKLGALRILEALHRQPGIVVINHHRIGDAGKSRFDRGVYSATADGLDQQIAQVKRHMPIVAGEELEALVTGRKPLTRTYAAITFDDGYLDNYTAAFPVLKHHRVPAIFFPVTQYAGTNTVTWWDEIAYLIRNSETGRAAVNTPASLEIALTSDRESAILRMLRHYKRPDNRDGEAFLAELRESTGCNIPDPGRRFLNWDEAREMVRAGMEFGSHTCSHTILSQQTATQQLWELTESRSMLQHRLGVRVHSLAYPVGSATAFSSETESLATQAGYTVAFSFQGGWNRPGSIRPTRINRISPAVEPELFRAELVALRMGLSR